MAENKGKPGEGASSNKIEQKKSQPPGEKRAGAQPRSHPGGDGGPEQNAGGRQHHGGDADEDKNP